jgi:hypothetical protein
VGDRQLVTRPEPAREAPVAVDPSAVCAAQVAYPEHVGVRGQTAAAPGDSKLCHADVAVGGTPDQYVRGVEGNVGPDSRAPGGSGVRVPSRSSTEPLPRRDHAGSGKRAEAAPELNLVAPGSVLHAMLTSRTDSIAALGALARRRSQPCLPTIR